MRTLTYYVATTIDGFSCGPDGSSDFFPIEEGTKDFTIANYPETLPVHIRKMLDIDGAENKAFDAILQGKGSYQLALEEDIPSPFPHAEQYVFSTSLPVDIGPGVTVVGTDPCSFVRELKQQEGLGLCLLGGPGIAGVLLPEIDELMIKRYPVIAGRGMPLFATEFDPAAFAPAWTHRFDSGADYTLYRRVQKG